MTPKSNPTKSKIKTDFLKGTVKPEIFNTFSSVKAEQSHAGNLNKQKLNKTLNVKKKTKKLIEV